MSCCGVSLPCFPTYLGGREGPSWRHVFVNVRDERGGLKKDIGSENDLVLHYIEDMHNGDLYAYENTSSTTDIAIKCFLVATFAAPYALIVIAAALLRTLLTTAQVAYHAFAAAQRDFELGKGYGSAFCSFFSTFSTDFMEQAWPALRQAVVTPLYWLQMEFGGVVGVFLPYDGRKIVADAQSNWFQVTFRDDPRDVAKREHRSITVADLSGRVCLLAYCFMPRGNIRDTISPSGSLKYEILTERTNRMNANS